MSIVHVPMIYLDESGFTGTDMLNAEQTVFVSASVSLSTDEASALLLETVGALKPGAQEHSHGVLAKTPDGQRRIVALLSELARREFPAARFYMIHKRFALLAKLIDNWVEPMMHMHGFDLTRDGAAVAYLNMVWFCLPSFVGEERFDVLLHAYQGFSRNPTPAGCKRFFDLVEHLLATSQHNTGKEMLAEILSARDLGPEHLDNLREGAHDVAYPAVFSTIAHWDSLFDCPFGVVHDQSKNLAPVHPMLEAVMSLEGDVERRRVGFDGTLTYSLPFHTAGLTFADSRMHPQLQIADLLAGAAVAVGRYLLNRSHKPEYAKMLITSGVMDALRFGWMWPIKEDIQRRPPVGPGVADPLEVTGHLISRVRPERTRATDEGL